MSQMLKSSGAMAAATLTSRVLGMVREVVYAGFMGTSWVAGAFYIAFQIPNLFRRLLGEGALTAAFIPIFKEKERTASEAEMWRAANAVISGLIMVASVITVLAILGISVALAFYPGWHEKHGTKIDGDDIEALPALAVQLRQHTNVVSQYFWDHFSESTHRELLDYEAGLDKNRSLRQTLSAEFNAVMAAGPIFNPALFAGVKLSPKTQALLDAGPPPDRLGRFNRLLIGDVYPESLGDVPKTELMLRLLRIMFPYMLLICLTAVFMGMLNARGHFFIPATGSLVMNLVMIASVFLLAPRLGKTLETQIFALAIGVLAAGAAQAAFQLPTLRAEGFRYHWVTPWGDPTVKQVVRQMIPGTIGVAAFQLNVISTQAIAFWVDPSIVASFNYAVRLMELPQGVFGISLATYLLPTLSGLAAKKQYDDFRSTLNQGLDHLVFVNLLASVLLLVMAEPIIRLLFEHGKFGPTDTQGTSFALMCLAPGLLAFSMVNILARAFYALGDTKTPMKISILCLTLNFAFAFLMVRIFRQGGLGLANTASAVINVSLLFVALRRKLGKLELAMIEKILLQIAVAGAAAAAVAWGLSRWWTHTVGHAGQMQRLGETFVPMIAAGLLYWGIALWFKVPPAMEIWGLTMQRLRRKVA